MERAVSGSALHPEKHTLAVLVVHPQHPSAHHVLGKRSILLRETANYAENYHSQARPRGQCSLTSSIMIIASILLRERSVKEW